MKKHLIQGALALGISATLISCHADEDLSYSVVDQKIQAYEQVFEEEFGKINPNQDWGFGQASAAARTRAIQAVLTRSLADNLRSGASLQRRHSALLYQMAHPRLLKAIGKTMVHSILTIHVIVLTLRTRRISRV